MAATRAFTESGFAATSLDDVAEEAAISRDMLYRHFESKAELYRAVLRRARDRLAAATGSPEFADSSLDALLSAAAAEPAGFRLVFRHAAREPEFRKEIDELRVCMFEVAYGHLADVIPDPAWARWASTLVPTVAVEGVIAWLDLDSRTRPSPRSVSVSRSAEWWRPHDRRPAVSGPELDRREAVRWPTRRRAPPCR